jgi:hypothetical protein
MLVQQSGVTKLRTQKGNVVKRKQEKKVLSYNSNYTKYEDGIKMGNNVVLFP